MVLVACGMVWLFLALGAERADRISSGIGAGAAIVGLVMAFLGWLRTRSSGTGSGDVPAQGGQPVSNTIVGVANVQVGGSVASGLAADTSFGGMVVQANRVNRILVSGPIEPAAGRFWELPIQRVDMWDPITLGVHRAIGGEAVLPRFIPRSHDQQLLRLLDLAHKSTVMVVLRGGSSVGKTRSAYEAVREQLSDWDLASPPDAATLVELLRAKRIGTRTVVWLDELQNYFDGPAGDLAAAGVRALLGSPGPVVVIGTLWPEYWEQYTVRPAALEEDAFAQARAMLGMAVCVDIPDTFTPEDLERARSSIAGSAVLRTAVVSAMGDGRLAQTLAGAQDLVDRYERATNPYARAVLAAAIDAAGLGHRTPFSASFLAEAGVGYLDDQQRAGPPDWLAQALAYASMTLRGAGAALTPVRRQPDLGPADGYKLADYLEQYGRRRVHGSRIPAALWEALAAHATDPADLSRLSAAARSRSYYRLARTFYAPSMHVHDPKGAHWAVNRLDRLSQGEDVNQAWRELAELGDTHAMRRLARRLDDAGNTDEGDAWRRRAAEAGSAVAMRGVAYRLDNRGEHDEAELWWRRAATVGDLVAIRALAQRLAGAGQDAEAETWWNQAIRAGDTKAMRAYAGYLDSVGKDADAGALWRRAAEAGDMVAIERVATTAQHQGRINEAIVLWHRPAWNGNEQAIRAYAALVQQTGDVDDVLHQWRSAVRLGDTNTVRRMVLLLVVLDRVEAARLLCAEAIEAGNGTVAWQLADKLGPADSFTIDATSIRHKAATGDRQAIRALAWLAVASGHTDQALDILFDAVHRGVSEAVSPLVKALRHLGRADDARRLRKFGLEPNGEIAHQ